MIADNIAQYLHGLAIVNYQATAATGNCFVNQMPDKPDAAVALFDYPGPAPELPWAYDTVSLQVRVRGGLDSRPPLQKLGQIYSALHNLHQVTLPGGVGLVLCTAVQSGAMPLGPDRTGQRLEFTQNYTLHIRRPTNHRR